MKTVLKAYKLRIYPDSEQEQKLNQTFGCVRVLWNCLVENFNAYGTDSYVNKLSEKEIKSREDLWFLKDVSAASLQQKRMDFAEFQNQYFNKNRKTKLGRPSFKKRSNRQSYRLPNQKFKVSQEDGYIQLEKIGKVKLQDDKRKFDTTDLRSATVSKTPTGEFYVSILVRTEVEQLPTTGRKLGIDLGLSDLMILSSGVKVNNPKWFRENQSKLAKAQIHLSRKKKGSNRYERQRLKVARIHRDITNQRQYFLHNLSKSIVRGFDVVCVEDLNVSGMLRNKNLSKAISEASWSSFVSMLAYKCDWYGRELVKVDRFYPSSQICSSCHVKDGKKELHVREWECSSCGAKLDRDFNASLNILFEGISKLTGLSVNETSAELVDYKRGEDVSLFGASHHLATSLKRLDKFIDLS